MDKSLFRRQWNEACKAAGLVSIGKDTAAKLLAIVYVLGGERECFTHNGKLIDDIWYIKDVYGIYGGKIPDQEVVKLVKQYSSELEANDKDYPQWATKLMQENYGIKL